MERKWMKNKNVLFVLYFLISSGWMNGSPWYKRSLFIYFFRGGVWRVHEEELFVFFFILENCTFACLFIYLSHGHKMEICKLCIYIQYPQRAQWNCLERKNKTTTNFSFTIHFFEFVLFICDSQEFCFAVECRRTITSVTFPSCFHFSEAAVRYVVSSLISCFIFLHHFYLSPPVCASIRT